MYFIVLVNRVILSGGFVLGCFPISFLVLSSPQTLVLKVTFTGHQIPSGESGLLSHGNTYHRLEILGWLRNESLSQQPPYLGGSTCPLTSLASVSVGKCFQFPRQAATPQHRPSSCVEHFQPLCSAGTKLITARILGWGPADPCGLSTRCLPFCSVSGTQLWLFALYPGYTVLESWFFSFV